MKSLTIFFTLAMVLPLSDNILILAIRIRGYNFNQLSHIACTFLYMPILIIIARLVEDFFKTVLEKIFSNRARYLR